MPTQDPADTVTAAILVIGDEILSGRTQDTNIAAIAKFLGPKGIRVAEVRIVPDVEEEIVSAVNHLRGRYQYVFTTGGIGPTHDDITADAIARAFGTGISHHPEAVRRLEAHYSHTPGMLNEARMRMARIPHGATLVDNPVSKAPGFEIGNVFVMAGVPLIMAAMLESIGPKLTGGAPLLSVTVGSSVPEGVLADGLRIIAETESDVSIGSYPFFKGQRYGTSLVLRSQDAGRLRAVAARVAGLIESLGGTPEMDEVA